ncbi:CPBP family intramembrane glutamic endopeptidase [Maribacter sp. ACAM166]|uniref:CPBP family intramembrane glutamic endopeptidase n=1 Tax=Maribacter sp. ACAM166 TaxID=2508996 RepID=UPI0010FEB76F|nr:CPBP family intramembrane glutamic endopeptidase [Maribacter sp. ACAM166]TLP77598.1 CPBP family intramembrane metalloprotease [Maribacter sp. ACAM166]
MYIEQAYKGLSDSWRYSIGIFGILVVWQVLAAIPLLAALALKDGGISAMMSGDIGAMSTVLGSNTFLFYMLLTFAIALLSIFVFAKFLHKQSITSLTTSRKKIDWKRIIFSFLLWALISVIFIFLDIYLSPEGYEFNFNLVPFLTLAVVAILMIPLQTSMEEYFMRGYMMQGLGIIAKNRWFPLIFTSLLFGLLHILNPEVEKLGYGILIFYIGTGFFLGIITLMDDGLELALGFHAANNLTAALLVTADWTAFQTNSLYRDISDPVLGWDVLVPVFIVFPILLYLFSKKYGWTNWKEKLTGKVLTEEEFMEQYKEEVV